MELLETAKEIHQTSFCNCTDLSYDNIVEWQSWLRSIRKCSTESCNARLASLKSFLKYLSIRDLKYRYLYLASLNVRRQKDGKRKVVGMSEIAVKSLLQEPDVHTATDKTHLKDLFNKTNFQYDNDRCDSNEPSLFDF